MIKILKNIPGTQKEIADALGVSQSAFSQWSNEGKKISANNAKKIEKLFGIPREQLRPDIYN